LEGESSGGGLLSGAGSPPLPGFGWSAGPVVDGADSVESGAVSVDSVSVVSVELVDSSGTVIGGFFTSVGVAS